VSNTSVSDLKKSFDSWAKMSVASNGNIVTVHVDHKAATRQAIIVALRQAGFTFKTRSEWNAKPAKNSDGADWDYDSIALHHAGNSYSCDADGAAQLRKAEATGFDKFGHLSYHYAISCDGVIYEALDIREKGAHIAGGNRGVIGIVMLADFSVHGEAWKEEYSSKPFLEKLRGLADWGRDKVDVNTDEPTDQQHSALSTLAKVLCRYFPVTMLGGHREFQNIANGQGRACPGVWGMILAEQLRKDLKLGEPAPRPKQKPGERK
jgi:hypothetical protein